MKRRFAMQQTHRRFFRNVVSFFTLIVLFSLVGASPAASGGYDNALKDVKGIKAVFDFSQGSPGMSNLIFWAVKNVYEDKSTNSLPEKPQVAVVFHGPAVKLISKDRSDFAEKDFGELDKFHDMIRQLKKDGVKLEVCLYAAKVVGVDPATILPEIDHVGNGFISVIGYQAQGYSVVRVP
jgi:intracellular sulfur oxidation DsrE/DsrF family protein